MHLYHTQQLSCEWSTIQIHDAAIIHQLKRVMRARSGQSIMIQTPGDNHMIRYECELITIGDTITATVVQTMIYPYRKNHKHLVVAMANKRDKMELIVQKATECGISQITIVPMHRSVITSRNAHKRKRLEAIMLEAVEQSWSTQVPVLQWCDNIKDLSNSESLWRGTVSWQVLLSNMGGQPMSDVTIWSDVTIIIWPEWWLDPKDIQILEQKQLDLTTISLWSTVLRMETAAIVGSWWINQH